MKYELGAGPTKCLICKKTFTPPTPGRAWCKPCGIKLEEKLIAKGAKQ